MGGSALLRDDGGDNRVGIFLRRHGRRAAERKAAVDEAVRGLARVRLVARDKCLCRGWGKCASCLCVSVLAYARWTARNSARLQSMVVNDGLLVIRRTPQGVAL